MNLLLGKVDAKELCRSPHGDFALSEAEAAAAAGHVVEARVPLFHELEVEGEGEEERDEWAMNDRVYEAMRALGGVGRRALHREPATAYALPDGTLHLHAADTVANTITDTSFFIEWVQ